MSFFYLFQALTVAACLLWWQLNDISNASGQLYLQYKDFECTFLVRSTSRKLFHEDDYILREIERRL